MVGGEGIGYSKLKTASLEQKSLMATRQLQEKKAQ